jgi:photosystem II stability/assembly factor-like uncharacterized protein
MLACGVQSKGAREEKTDAAAVAPRQAIESGLEAAPTAIAYAQIINRVNWFIADFTHLWRTVDEGQTWVQIYSLATNLTAGKHINGLNFIDNQVGFLIVDRQVLRTTDGGISWNELSKLNFGAQSVYFVDAQRGWVAGSIWREEYMNDPKASMYVGVIFATRDGGQTWEQQRTDLPEGYFDAGVRWYLSDVFFDDQQTGWTVGFGVTFWTVDGGKNWHVADAWKGQYQHVRFLDKAFGWATQREGAEFSVTADGGKHWRLLDGPPAFGSWATGVVFITPRQWLWRPGSSV